MIPNLKDGEDITLKIAAAMERYDRLSVEEKRNHDYEQRRSFVRGMCPSNRDYDLWCKTVDQILPPLPKD